jgi:hypothetical protein
MELPEMTSPEDDELPDVRDGLNYKERIILHCLHQAQKELGRDNVPTVMLYGRVVERLDMSPEEFQELLRKLMGQNV